MVDDKFKEEEEKEQRILELLERKVISLQKALESKSESPQLIKSTLDAVKNTCTVLINVNKTQSSRTPEGLIKIIDEQNQLLKEILTLTSMLDFSDEESKTKSMEKVSELIKKINECKNKSAEILAKHIDSSKIFQMPKNRRAA